MERTPRSPECEVRFLAETSNVGASCEAIGMYSSAIPGSRPTVTSQGFGVMSAQRLRPGGDTVILRTVRDGIHLLQYARWCTAARPASPGDLVSRAQRAVRRVGPRRCLASSGCATVLHGTSQEIEIVSNPPGATA
jgi:hypothetical protein